MQSQETPEHHGTLRLRFAAAGSAHATAGATEKVSTFLRAVYGWMCVGLGITATVASSSRAPRRSSGSSRRTASLFWGLMIAQLGIVFVLSARVAEAAPAPRPRALHRLLGADRA